MGGKDGVLRGFGSEMGPAFYDGKAATAADRQVHYTRSRYYPLWTVVVDRWRRAGRPAAIEIGCGSGQLARMLADQGCREYLGIDFSPGMIALARYAAPQARFTVADIRDSDILATHEYDCAIMLEVLEHIADDRAVIERLRPGTRVIGSVPNFPAKAHVRHFRDAQAVIGRYGPLMSNCEVIDVQMDEHGSRLFLLDGVR